MKNTNTTSKLALSDLFLLVRFMFKVEINKTGCVSSSNETILMTSHDYWDVSGHCIEDTWLNKL